MLAFGRSGTLLLTEKGVNKKKKEVSGASKHNGVVLVQSLCQLIRDERTAPSRATQDNDPLLRRADRPVSCPAIVELVEKLIAPSRECVVAWVM